MSTPSHLAHPNATQVAHPWRAVLRTLFAVVVGFSVSWGTVVQELHLNPTWQWVSVATLLAGLITRALAIPAVETALQKYFPWLAALPRPQL